MQLRNILAGKSLINELYYYMPIKHRFIFVKFNQKIP